MSSIKMDIQLFARGWSQGITQSEVDETYNRFSGMIDEIVEAINNYSSVDTALTEGWSGKDCQDYLDKFHEHAGKICEQVEEYRTAVHDTVEEIKDQWETFQDGLIS